MRFVIEVVADDRENAVRLLRDAALKIKRCEERHGRENNHIIGDYRIFVGEDVYESLTVEHALCEKGRNHESRDRSPSSRQTKVVHGRDDQTQPTRQRKTVSSSSLGRRSSSR